MMLLANCCVATISREQEPKITPLSVKLFTEDVLIDDWRLSYTGFAPQYTPQDFVADTVNYFTDTPT